MLMTKQDLHRRRRIAQTLDYQAQGIMTASQGITAAVSLLLNGADNEACSALLMLSFNLGKQKEMIDRMLAEVRLGHP